MAYSRLWDGIPELTRLAKIDEKSVNVMTTFLEEKRALHESYASALQALVVKAQNSGGGGAFSTRRGVGEAVADFLRAHGEEAAAQQQLARETGTQANALASIVADKQVRKLCSEAQAIHKRLDSEMSKLAKAKAARDSAALQAAEADHALTYFGKYGVLPDPSTSLSSSSSSLGKMLGAVGGALSQQPTAESLAAAASTASHKLETAEREYVARVENAKEFRGTYDSERLEVLGKIQRADERRLATALRSMAKQVQAQAAALAHSQRVLLAAAQALPGLVFGSDVDEAEKKQQQQQPPQPRAAPQPQEPKEETEEEALLRALDFALSDNSPPSGPVPAPVSAVSAVNEEKQGGGAPESSTARELDTLAVSEAAIAECIAPCIEDVVAANRTESSLLPPLPAHEAAEVPLADITPPPARSASQGQQQRKSSTSASASTKKMAAAASSFFASIVPSRGGGSGSRRGSTVNVDAADVSEPRESNSSGSKGPEVTLTVPAGERSPSAGTGASLGSRTLGVESGGTSGDHSGDERVTAPDKQQQQQQQDGQKRGQRGRPVGQSEEYTTLHAGLARMCREGSLPPKQARACFDCVREFTGRKALVLALSRGIKAQAAQSSGSRRSTPMRLSASAMAAVSALSLKALSAAEQDEDGEFAQAMLALSQRVYSSRAELGQLGKERAAAAAKADQNVAAAEPAEPKAAEGDVDGGNSNNDSGDGNNDTSEADALTSDVADDNEDGAEANVQADEPKKEPAAATVVEDDEHKDSGDNIDEDEPEKADAEESKPRTAEQAKKDLLALWKLPELTPVAKGDQVFLAHRIRRHGIWESERVWDEAFFAGLNARLTAATASSEHAAFPGAARHAHVVAHLRSFAQMMRSFGLPAETVGAFVRKTAAANEVGSVQVHKILAQAGLPAGAGEAKFLQQQKEQAEAAAAATAAAAAAAESSSLPQANTVQGHLATFDNDALVALCETEQDLAHVKTLVEGRIVARWAPGDANPRSLWLWYDGGALHWGPASEPKKQTNGNRLPLHCITDMYKGKQAFGKGDKSERAATERCFSLHARKLSPPIDLLLEAQSVADVWGFLKGVQWVLTIAGKRVKRRKSGAGASAGATAASARKERHDSTNSSNGGGASSKERAQLKLQAGRAKLSSTTKEVREEIAAKTSALKSKFSVFKNKFGSSGSGGSSSSGRKSSHSLLGSLSSKVSSKRKNSRTFVDLEDDDDLYDDDEEEDQGIVRA